MTLVGKKYVKCESNWIKNTESNQIGNRHLNRIGNCKLNQVKNAGQLGTANIDDYTSVGYLMSLDAAT